MHEARKVCTEMSLGTQEQDDPDVPSSPVVLLGASSVVRNGGWSYTLWFPLTLAFSDHWAYHLPRWQSF